jgi:hypothetical protein
LPGLAWAIPKFPEEALTVAEAVLEEQMIAVA